MTDETLLAAARLMRDHDIDLVWRGGYSLDPKNVPLAIRDPEAMTAKVAGMSIDELRAFRSYDVQCRAVTRKEHRCKNSVVGTGDIGGADHIPESFDPSSRRWLYCHTHQ